MEWSTGPRLRCGSMRRPGRRGGTGIGPRVASRPARRRPGRRCAARPLVVRDATWLKRSASNTARTASGCPARRARRGSRAGWGPPGPSRRRPQNGDVGQVSNPVRFTGARRIPGAHEGTTALAGIAPNPAAVARAAARPARMSGRPARQGAVLASGTAHRRTRLCTLGMGRHGTSGDCDKALCPEAATRSGDAPPTPSPSAWGS